MSPSILDLVPALILVPKPAVRLGHRMKTLPAPKPPRAASSPTSQVVRRNERRFTRGFLAAGRGVAGRVPVVIAIGVLPLRGQDQWRVTARRTGRWSPGGRRRSSAGSTATPS